MTDDRGAALVVRVWLEGGADQFRARVTSVGLDETEHDRTVALASSPSEVLTAVGQWLADFLRHGTTTD